VVWVFIIIGAIVLLLVIGLVAIYNRLVRDRNRVDNAWHQIDVQLKRRYDLIPTWWRRSRATPATRKRSSRRSPRRGQWA
jgi:hypothetical protein